MVSTSLAIPDNLLYQEKWVRFKYLAVIKIYETIKQSLCVSFMKKGYFQRAGCFCGLSLFIHSTATAEGRRQVTHEFCLSLRGRTDCNSEQGTKSLYCL